MLAHDRRGSGPPLVLIHGIGARRGAWDPVVKLLADTRETIAIDLPGFGESPPLPAGEAATIAAFIDAVEQFFADAGLDRPHVAGNSMGGGIALELARRGVVASAAALSPIGFWNTPEKVTSRATLRMSRLMARRASPVTSRLVSSAPGRIVALSSFYGHPTRLDPAVARADIAALAASTGFDAALPRLRDYAFADGAALDPVPVTIGWGTRDRLLLYRTQSQRARQRLPHARHVPLPGCGHLPMHDDPDAVASLLRVASADSADAANGVGAN
ncbi:MAG TPA: alpha/beta fold hydrolase [Conexibacter sp.]|jgi:pimeloyl-ACP methyl ester carboxylesterase